MLLLVYDTFLLFVAGKLKSVGTDLHTPSNNVITGSICSTRT